MQMQIINVGEKIQSLMRQRQDNIRRETELQIEIMNLRVANMSIDGKLKTLRTLQEAFE